MITTGFSSLDKALRGWNAGDFVVIAAKPRMGKEKMMISLITRASIINKIPCVLFSNSTPTMETICKLGICACKEKSHDVEDFIESPNINDFMEAPIWIDDCSCLQVGDFKQKVAELVGKKDIKLIFIENLHMIYAGSNFNSRKEEVDFICDYLKSIAIELGVTIITFCHIGQTFDTIKKVKPSINDVKSENFNPNIADTVILLNRPGYYRTDAVRSRSVSESMEIIIAKSKYVSNGTIKFLYDDWGIYECSTAKAMPIYEENEQVSSPVAVKDIIGSMLEGSNGFNDKNS